MAIVENFRSEFGLTGGTLLSGSSSATFAAAFCYYPLVNSTANIATDNIINGANINDTFIAGIPVYGSITQVTQTDGLAIVYHAIPSINPSY